MDTLTISGVKRIQIVDESGVTDDTRVISFNPSDVLFAEKFYALINAFQVKQEEFTRRAEELDKDTAVDGNGIPKNALESLDLLREICEYLRGEIDKLFGAGTSQMAFGSALSLESIDQFFVGVMPFVQSARTNKIEKYVGKRSTRVMK